MHIVKLLQNWLMEIEGNIEVMICLSQGGLCSLSASSSFLKYDMAKLVSSDMTVCSAGIDTFHIVSGISCGATLVDTA